MDFAKAVTPIGGHVFGQPSGDDFSDLETGN